jgi:hypothetical protein
VHKSFGLRCAGCAPFHDERLIAKPERKAFFRRAVLQAYEERCAVTGGSSSTAADATLLLVPQTPGAGLGLAFGQLSFPRISSGRRSALRSAVRGPN